MRATPEKTRTKKPSAKVPTKINKCERTKKRKKGKKGKKKGNATTSSTSSSDIVLVTKRIDGFPREDSATSFAPRHDAHLHLRRIHELDLYRCISRSFQMSFILLFRTKALRTIESFEMGTNKLRFENRFLQFTNFNQASPIRYEELVSQLDLLD